MNCESCITDYYKKNGTNNCYNIDLLNEGYYLKDNLFYKCEENCLTCSDGKTLINDIISNNCLSCDKINKGLYLVYDLKNCEPIEYKNNGYYLGEDINGNEILYKCYESCLLCDKGKEFDSDTNKDNHNCLSCAENNYKLRNDLNPKNCYGNEMFDLGYTILRNYWEICYKNCDSCSDAPIYDGNNELITQNCLGCLEGFYFVYQTSNCFNDSILEKGYYFNDIDSYYHKCDIQCKTCQRYSTESDPNCLLCNIDQGYYPAENKPISHCYNRTTINSEYTLSQLYDNEKNIYYKKWVICYSTCLTCSSYGDITHQNCINCKTKYYLLDDTTNCVTENYAISNGYYFNTTYKKFLKCDKACTTCNAGKNNKNTNCIKCNENEEYYSIYQKSDSNCYNNETIEEGFYLDKFENPFKWKKCYENCATCEYQGNEYNMKCLSCKHNFLSKKYNKIMYLKFSNGNCIENCPDNLFLTKNGLCVETCPYETYKYFPNTSCVDSCPKNYIVDSDKIKCISNIFEQSISMTLKPK